MLDKKPVDTGNAEAQKNAIFGLLAAQLKEVRRILGWEPLRLSFVGNNPKPAGRDIEIGDPIVAELHINNDGTTNIIQHRADSRFVEVQKQLKQIAAFDNENVVIEMHTQPQAADDNALALTLNRICRQGDQSAATPFDGVYTALMSELMADDVLPISPKELERRLGSMGYDIVTDVVGRRCVVGLELKRLHPVTQREVAEINAAARLVEKSVVN